MSRAAESQSAGERHIREPGRRTGPRRRGGRRRPTVPSNGGTVAAPRRSLFRRGAGPLPRPGNWLGGVLRRTEYEPGPVVGKGIPPRRGGGLPALVGLFN